MAVKGEPESGCFHVLSAIKPEFPRCQAESDLAFSAYHLQKVSNFSMKHAFDVLRTFQKVDSGAPISQNQSDSKTCRNSKDRGGRSENTTSKADDIKMGKMRYKNLPLGLRGSRRSKGYH